MLESPTFNRLFAPFITDTASQKARLLRYYLFWEALRPLLTMPRVYTFVTGKSDAFMLVGLDREFRLPSLHKFVVLDALSERDIIDTFDASRFEAGGWLRDTIKFSDVAMKKRFLAAVAHETAGHPRFVQYFLQKAARYVRDTNPTIDSDAAITKVLKEADRMTEAVLNLEALHAKGLRYQRAVLRTPLRWPARLAS